MREDDGRGTRRPADWIADGMRARPNGLWLWVRTSRWGGETCWAHEGGVRRGREQLGEVCWPGRNMACGEWCQCVLVPVETEPGRAGRYQVDRPATEAH